MFLVVSDGGSSKADWRFVINGNVGSVTSTGFNPSYDGRERIAAILKSELSFNLPDHVKGLVYYYGAGCKDPVRKTFVKEVLGDFFSNCEIFVFHDMLAAARATCGNQPGIACILGTGSNSVLFDGSKEIDQVTNLGYLLGDEGSGSHIGKELVRSFFYREMPAELQHIMEQACPNGRKDILNNVYGGTMPAAYLASFAKLFTEQAFHPFVKNIIKSCFEEFLSRHVCKYENYQHLPIHFVGSVAFYFQSILQEAMEEKELIMGTVLRKPIDQLLSYHLSPERKTSPPTAP